MDSVCVVQYFGPAVVECAVADYFSRHGINEQTRDKLMIMEAQRPADFLEMVCDFVDKGMPNV